jgi:hypothetical protein
MNHAVKGIFPALAGVVLLGFTTSRADEPRPRPGLDLKAIADTQVRQAQKPDAKTQEAKFIRIKKDNKGEPVALQTAVARYVPATGKGGLEVDLVSVVHIGDRHYYEQLNDRFENYDAVLYELVAPKNFRIPRGGKNSNNPIAFLQKAMTLVLGLDLQTSCIDYTCTNFVHADLSPEEMAEAIKKRGDTPLTLALSVVADVLREQNLREMKQKQAGGAPKQPELEFDPLALLTDPQAISKLKRIMAEQLAEASGGSGLGKTLDTILISDRNSAAIKVFQKQLAAGKKKIAIFYGAAHMPDFERQLMQDFGLRRQNVEWYTAWDLRPRALNPLDLLKIAP